MAPYFFNIVELWFTIDNLIALQNQVFNRIKNRERIHCHWFEFTTYYNCGKPQGL